VLAVADRARLRLRAAEGLLPAAKLIPAAAAAVAAPAGVELGAPVTRPAVVGVVLPEGLRAHSRITGQHSRLGPRQVHNKATTHTHTSATVDAC